MKIKATIERVPGGMMIIPLFLGATLNTFAPGTAEFFGGFTGALITGTLPILGVFIFCVGATIDFRSSGYIARKGLTLLIGKVGFAALLGLIAAQFIPDEGIQSGFFAGLSVLAIVAVMNETNGGLYLALMNHMGRKEDAGAFAFISTESGPFMTMVTLVLQGLRHFLGRRWLQPSSRFYSAAFSVTLTLNCAICSEKSYRRSFRSSHFHLETRLILTC